MIKILLAFAGITGIGKSFYKDKLCEVLNFSKIKIITTRAPRTGEKNNIDKIFLSKDELKKLSDNGKIAYQFELLGVDYAYSKDQLFSNNNIVFEMHYSTIADFKKICPHLTTIYLMPTNINIAKKKLKERHLKPETEIARLNEIDEHYKKITTDKKLLGMFDYIIYNNYDKKSEYEVINLVKELLKGEK